MALDVYFKLPEQEGYSYVETEVEDEVEKFLQQVEMVLTTRRGEVLGEPDFGANLEDWLWNDRASSKQVEESVRRQISNYCAASASRIRWDVSASFIAGQVTDSILLDVTIDGTKVLGIGVVP